MHNWICGWNCIGLNIWLGLPLEMNLLAEKCHSNEKVSPLGDRTAKMYRFHTPSLWHFWGVSYFQTTKKSVEFKGYFQGMTTMAPKLPLAQ
jgi:hypothetical protein